MKLLLHDLDRQTYEELLPQDPPGVRVIGDDGEAAACADCRRCWTGTPGRCAVRDSLGDMAGELASCSGLVVISRCVYGSYSPFVKKALERCLPLLRPELEMHDGQTRHALRGAAGARELAVVFYGGADLPERRTAGRLARGSAVRLGAELRGVTFIEDIGELRGMLG